MQSDERLSQCYTKTPSCWAILRTFLTGKKGFKQTIRSRASKTTETASAFCLSHKSCTTHNMVNTSAQVWHLLRESHESEMREVRTHFLKFMSQLPCSRAKLLLSSAGRGERLEIKLQRTQTMFSCNGNSTGHGYLSLISPFEHTRFKMVTIIKSPQGGSLSHPQT